MERRHLAWLAAVGLLASGCDVVNWALPSNFFAPVRCSAITTDCLREACEDCEADCLRSCWEELDDTAVNYGCPDGTIVHGLSYCNDAW
jgi:hypothetical protein